MNEQFRVAQATGAGNSNNASPPRIFKLTKPFADQAVVLNLGYDQKVQVDFSAISNEKITLVHIGEKLIILFDNHSTVTVEPFFDSRHDQLGNLTIEVAPGRDLTVAEFASAFPIINDPSAASAVLPAAGDELGQNNAQASGANFSPFTVDPLPPVPTNTLAPQEELPTFQVDFPTGFVLQPTTPPAPTISLGTLPELVVDESFLTSATNGIDGTTPSLPSTTVSGLLPVTLNVPGGQQSLTFALSISAPGVDTGLIDSQTGNHVYLFLENGVVVGREGKDAAAAAVGPQDFTVSVDGSGKLTLTDLRSVHEGTGENGDVSEGTHVPTGLISLTATVTDNSNQSSSASADVGPHLTLQDDGPSIQVVLDGEERFIPNLTVDESNLTALTNGIDGSIHNGNNTAIAWFGGIFQAVTGADGVADPQHPISYALSIDASKSTGLVDSQTGENVVLVMNGTTVEGHTASSNLLVFTLSVDSNGFVTFTDDRAVKEPDGTNPDLNEGISIASGAVTLTATITDNDGDTASTGIDLGKQVTFHDDGPSITVTTTAPADALVVDETNLAINATANFADNFTSVPNFGADGAGTTASAYTLGIQSVGVDSGLIDVATGQHVYLYVNGGVVEGRVGAGGVADPAGTIDFTVSVSAAGVVTLDQIHALSHPDTTNPDDAVTLSAANLITITRTDTITDRDGDTATSSASIGIGQALTFHDDGPSITVTTTAPADALVVDETNLAINATANFADNFTSVPNFGADGAGTTASAYTLGIQSVGVDSGLIDVATGQHVYLYVNGGVVEGRVGAGGVADPAGTIDFTVSVSAAGVVTLDQIHALSHPDTTNPDDAVTLSAANLITITRTDTITDRDGDTATSSASIGIGQALTFHDDGPSITVTTTAPADALVVDETNLAINATANFADNFTSVPNFGADGAGTTASAYTLGIQSVGVDSGLIDVATGQHVYLYVNGGVVEGRVGAGGVADPAGTIDFTVSVSAAGVVTLDQIHALSHPDTTNPDDAVTLSAVNLITITRTDTITDRDGDTATSSASIGIGQALTFHDDGPSITVTTTAPADALVVDETNLAINATANFADNFTSVPNFGADGAGTTASAYTLGIQSVGVDSGLIDVATGQHVYLYVNGGVVEGRVGAGGVADPAGTIDFTVSVSAAGVVTLDQIHALSHPDTTNPDDAVTLSAANLITITRTDTITDRDGDTATSSASIGIGQALTFHDDGPSITVTTTAPADALVVDETNLAINATANFADNFTSVPNFGADGAGTTASAYTLGIQSVGVDSGLIDVATGQHVYLYVNGGVVEGRVGAGGVADPAGTIDFTVSVSAAGVVTLDQIHALSHPDTTNPDDAVTLSAANLITITRTDTITDRDGDTATSSASIGIGQALTFHDDGPSITVTTTAPADALVVDETNLAINATANFADNFTSVPNFGADGAGTTASAYTLGIQSVGVDSGLIDVATGQHVYLYVNGGVVEGRVGAGGVADPAGTIDFTVSVSAAGVVTLDQIHALSHPDTTNPDDAVTLSAVNLITITRTDTITDRDGDTATSSASIGIGQALTFHDDGPSITVTTTAPADALVVDETNLAINATANFADNFTSVPNFGADGAGTTASAYTLGIQSVGVDSGLIDVATGQHVYLYVNGGVVEGRVGAGGVADPAGTIDFTVSVSAAGVVTLDQIHALSHPDTTNPDDAVTLSAANLITITRTDTITDRDGDTATSSASIGIGQALTFHDDGPSITVTTTAPADALVVDETNLAINATANFADNFTSVPNFGADGAGTTASAYTLGIQSVGVDSGLIDVATGQHVYLYVNGGVVEGRVGAGGVADPAGTIDFTVSVSAAGVVTLDQIHALSHPDTTNPDDAVTLSAANLITITRTDTITDRDGDTATSSASIGIGQALTFHDDGPSITVTTTAPADALVVDETNLAINATANFADNFTSVPNFGADGAGTTASAYTLGIQSVGVDSGLIDVATGQHVYLYVNGGVVEGRVGAGGVADPAGTIDFTVSVSAAGVVTLDQIHALSHPDTTNPDDAVTLSAVNLITITRTDTITDRDGDTATSSASIGIGQALTFHDDGPSITVTTTAPADALVVDETNLAINATANFADNFTSVPNFGADGAGTTASAYTLGIQSVGVDSGLIDVATGQHVYLYVNGGVVEGRVGAGGVADPAGTIDFTVSVSAAGVVTLDQIHALSHPDTTNPDDAVTLSAVNLITITRTDTITDRDGDTATSSASIGIGQALTFHDDGPSITVTTTAPADALVVDETNLAINATANFADNFTSVPNFGADGAGTTASAYTLGIQSVGVDSGLIDVATGQHVYLYVNGGVVEGRVGAGGVADPAGTIDFTVSVSAAGVVTLDQIHALSHPDTTNPDDAVTLSAANLITITRTDTITDRDGDTATSSASIGIGQALTFHDDGPSITVTTTAPADALVVDETNLAINATANFADNFTSVPNFGADGAGTTASAYTLGIQSVGVDSGLIDVATGQHVYLYVNGGVVEGRVGAGGVADPAGTIDFTVSVSAAGVVTLDQIHALSHPDTTNPDDAVTLSAANLITITRTDTITDRDGDTATSSASIGIGQALTFHDDGPKANTVTATPVLDDDAQTLFPGNPGGTGDVANATVATGAAGALFSAGADGLKSVSFTAPSGLKAIYKDANGLAAQETLHYTTTTAAGGHTIYTAIGDSSGHTVFTLDVGADGSYTFTMSEPLVSPTIGTTEENLSVQIGFTVTDGDNDTVTGALTVQVNDDTPGITAGSIQDAILNTVAGSEVHGTWQPVFGADGPNAAAAIAIAIPSTGSGLTYAQTDLGVISGHHVFQIDVSGGTSPYTFYEYSQFNAATQQAEMFAFTDISLTTSFFTLDVNANGTYDFNLNNTSGFEHTVLANASTAKPGNYNPEMFIVGTSFYDGATLPAGTTPDISIDGFDVSGGGHVDENVFVNANGIAVQNGNFEANELMTFHFTGAQTEVQFSLGKFQAGSTSEFTVSLDGGATHTYVISTSSPIIDIKASDFGLTSFHDIDLTKIASALATDDPTVDIETIRYNSVTTLDTTSLNFVLTVTDGDGDQFTSTADPLTVSLIGGGHTLTGTTGPEVIGATSSVETLNGGTGTNDTIDYEHSTAGVNVNLQTNAVSGGWAAGDTISNFENVIGSAFNDTLTALNTGSILDGGTNSTGGTDTLIGGNGNDVLIASRAGVDSLTGGGGNDTFVLHGDGATNVSITDFNASGTDGIVVDVADQALTINTAALINAATQFASGNGAPTTGGVGWTESTSADKFYLNTSDNTLWYSASGTGSDQVLLAHMSTGVAPSAIHVA
ncbi:hypothetical protein KUL72_14350 [Bradyrhizobium arachidis]|uniref:DUF5801 repeats-in-toxin domain-containing protein n=1 Tax=Bradyrhizobium arachidis TaxID=858423 RepID=UPI00220FEDE2|nr:DUF5801 repeats-in-toxin domain-containing protein [Bradyrhizobium arachidis]UVO39441.1 hypothetical protein KUL72_14350 [Bradyrhizobium arachidis]